MNRSISAQVAALTLLVFVVLSMGLGSSVTYGYLSDTETADGSVSAASSFGSGSPPEGAAGWNDANGNGRYDEGETTYSAGELENFDDESANLVIPEETGAIDAGNRDVSITAGSITSNVDIASKTRDVSLTATDGGIDLGGKGVSISGGSGTVDISATGDIDLSSSSITTNTGAVSISTDGELNLDDSTITVDGGNGGIELDAERISARNSEMETNTGGISLSATRNSGGELDATGGSLAVSGGGNGGITLESVGDMYLDGATLTSTNGQATADLNVDSPETTIHVENISVNDRDGTLTYAPSTVTEDPDNGAVSS
ncbi:SipW-dependent-type signal peptide-containing protein [Halosimplex sp. J119]